MRREAEIYILEDNGNLIGKLDLRESDFELKITKSISTIKLILYISGYLINYNLTVG